MKDSTILDRSMLEYHLNTLTSRSQETDFERFARRLAQLEICPNLLPQTGPTGGGDSKVDSETYPVADDLSLGWYVGTGREAASERWAFAFSAKKKWRPKVSSDIAKIAESGRGYSKAFFVSSQFIRDKERAEVEDKLREKHGIDVRILDRSWILDRVFKNGHETLAIEELRLKTEVRKEVRKGPLDVQRESDLEEVEKRIDVALLEGRKGLPLVNDCIEAALLARSLERPRNEVEGRFLRAEDIAKKYGTSHQHLVSVYQRAWAMFWWYEDYKLLTELYDTAEELAKDSGNVYDLELLHNLWLLLFGAVNRGYLSRKEIGFQQRTSTLAAGLERLSVEHDRPSTALEARTLLLLQRLALSGPEELDPVLRELQEVVRQCEGLVGYPLEPLVKMMMEFGDDIGEIPAYEELFETLVAVAATREGEIVAARMLLRRGAQQLDDDRPYEAIRFLGRALKRLYKHESRNELIRALYLCGHAYERVGLLWAARGTVLTAASVATDEFWIQSGVTLLQAVCYNRLRWLELQLGRLPHILSWHELDSTVRSILSDQGYDPEQLAQGEIEFDAILGILLLRADIWQLNKLTTLPDVLNAMNLPMASLALIYALGYEEELPKDIATRGDETPYDFFVKLRDQPAAEDLPAQPFLYECRTVTLSSSVLGCRITVVSENESPCIELAESVLAALESLLSTSLVESVAALEPALSINIRRADFAAWPFEFKMAVCNGTPHVKIRCASFDPHSLTIEAQGQVKNQIFKLLMDILIHTFFLDDAENVAKKLFDNEVALERAIDFTSSFVTLGNVLGHDPKTKLSSWVNGDVRDYPLLRREEWDASHRLAKASDSGKTKRQLTMGKGELPAELRDKEQIKHSQLETVSIIRVQLWDQASWSGTAFMMDPANRQPPVFSPIFKDENAAKQIFALWRDELGIQDAGGMLRITIVRGISRVNPFAYRVIIGVNPSAGFSRPDIKYTMMVSRLNTMVPSTDTNLNTFLASYKACGAYFLVPSVIRDDPSGPVPIWENYFIKRDLYVREAWEIGRHDVDLSGVNEEDDPIIPPDQADAPVLELLRWKRQRSGS